MKIYALTLSILFFFLYLGEVNSQQLPEDIPVPIVDIVNSPSPGGIFLSPFGPALDTAKYNGYFIILDSAASSILSYKLVPNQDQGFVGYHFKQETNGLLSYMSRKLDGSIYLTDTLYNVVTTFTDTTNPYKRVKYFAHFDLLPNGNYLTVRYDFQYVDHSLNFPKGEPNGAVLQAIIQELDKDKNVLFQWRSLDHVPVNLTYDPPAPNIDYFHPNSIAIHTDGNLLISARDLSSIIKINRNTGEIMWNLGGKKNDFTFIGDNEELKPTYFSYQHDIRVLPNGNITLFDNGRQHDPQFSRAIEYKLDEVNKTATLVWEYRHSPDIYADQHGSAQRMPNGNTLIAWGTYSMGGGAAITEVTPDKNKALEFHFPSGLESQFIYKFPWPACQTVASINKKELQELNTYDFNNSNGRTGVKLTFNQLNAFTYNELTVDKFDCSPMNPEFQGRPPIVSPYRFELKPYQIYKSNSEIYVSLTDFPLAFQPEKSKIWFRPQIGSGVFKELETVYISESNELKAVSDTAGGEFIIAYPDVAVITPAPILHSPSNNEKPNVEAPLKFSWNPMGYFKSSQIQVAKDTSFNTVLIDTTLKVINYSSDIFENGEKYFWRVRSANEAGFSPWSDIRVFTMSEPYLKLLVPNGGEVWINDSTRNNIRWEYNVKDSVNQIFKVEVYRADTLFRTLAPQRFSAYNALSWFIPKNFPEDSTYKIKVTSVKFPNISAMSENYFTITSTTSAEDKKEDVNSAFISVYPNPAVNIAEFSINAQEGGHATLKVYNLDGSEVVSLFDQYILPGDYRFNWRTDKINPGVYFYVLKINGNSRSGRLVVIK